MSLNFNSHKINSNNTMASQNLKVLKGTGGIFKLLLKDAGFLNF
jgi:hypothetical protein